MAKYMAEIVYSCWGEDIEQHKETSDVWKYFMARFWDLQCEKQIVDECNEDELVTDYMNNKRKKLWS